MAQNPNNRRKLAPHDPQVSKPITDLTGKRHPGGGAATSSAVNHLTNHLSRLQTQHPLQHKLAKSASFEKRVFWENGKKVVKHTKTQDPLVVTHLQAQGLARSASLEEKRVFWESGGKNEVQIKQPTTKKVVIDKRKSFCDAKVELANFLGTNCAKVVSVDMPPFMQIHAVGFARKIKDSLEKFTSKSLALSLKKEFDGAYGPAWHCIVGTSFGSFVTHSVGGFMYFSLDQKLYILLFKTTVHRAD